MAPHTLVRGPAEREHPKWVGDRSTLAIMLALVEAGWIVSMPFGENTQYDLVLDSDGALLRVQCKTGRLRKGVIRFSTASTYAHHGSSAASRRAYTGEIDAFAVYCPENDRAYLLPIADVPCRAAAFLRVDPARNNQSKHVRQAARYEITAAVTRRGRPPPD